MRSGSVSGPNAPLRVTLLHRDARLGAELLALLGEGCLVNVVSSPIELAKGGPAADVVVVDVPAEDRRAVCEQVRRQYHGPLIVLLNLGDNSHDLSPDHSRILLARPFSMRDLSVALAASRPTQPALTPVGHLRLALPLHGVQDGGKPDRVVPAVPRLVRSWRERRLLRVSVISIAAALAFTGAFALVNQYDGCGPGCDELTGADLTSPSNPTQAFPISPGTIDSGAGTVAPTTTDSSVGLAAAGGSGTDEATSGEARISPTTGSPSVAPSPTSPPDPTHPQTTAPSPTAPTTTAPRASTPTTTTTSTTTTTATTTTTVGP
jgi:hypothetical protein